MTVISGKEFAVNQQKYFDMAITEKIGIKNGENMFHLMYHSTDKTDVYEPVYLEPDDDLRNAITMDELLDSTIEFIHKLYAKK